MNFIKYILSGISVWKKQIAISIFCFLFILLFETFQQYYYVIYFELKPENIQLSNVFKAHLIRWIIWFIVSIPFILFLKRKPLNSQSLNLENFVGYFLGILFMITVNVSLICFVEIFTSDFELTRSVLSNLLVFYIFQKGPIYFIAYLILIAVVHLFIYAESLNLKIQELAQLKLSHKELYEELKNSSYDDNSYMINVKIGNKWKIVPLETILWIEADDYCVKLHINDGASYTIRTSMKSLEEKLPSGKFLRIHRKSIVSIDSIREYYLSEVPKVILENGVTINIAQSRIKEVKQLLNPEMRISS